MYDTLQKSMAPQTTKAQLNLNKLFPSPVGDWTTYYSIPLLYTSACRLKGFQYWIFHRPLAQISC